MSKVLLPGENLTKNMKLLNPDYIKNDKNISIEESIKRTRKLASEEAKLSKSIDIAKEKTKKSIKIINSELEEEKISSERQKSFLKTEISQLKEERQELLEPIDEIKNEATNRLKKVIERESDLKIKKEDLAKDIIKENNNKENFENEKKKFIKDKKILKTESNRICYDRVKINDSQAKLNKLWNNYKELNKKATERRIMLDARAESLDIESKSIESIRYSLEEKEKGLKSLQRKLHSERRAIAKAKIHLGIL